MSDEHVYYFFPTVFTKGNKGEVKLKCQTL